MSEETPKQDGLKPDWSGLTKAFAEIGNAIEQAGHLMAAQGALGWILQGDIGRARDALEGLPVERLQAVSVAAAALSSLSDEIAAEAE